MFINLEIYEKAEGSSKMTNSGAHYVQKSNKYELKELKKAIAELYLMIKQKTRDEVRK